MNILYCEGNIDGTIGGSYFSLLYLISGLDKSKYRPLVVFHKENPLIQRFEQAGIQTLIIPKPKPFVIKQPASGLFKTIVPLLRLLQRSINFTRFFLITGARYALVLRRHQINLVHLNNSITRNHEWMLAAKLAGVKCITHERGINAHYSRMSRYFGKRLNAIVCISDAVRENFRVRSVDTDNMVTIYNGIDPDIVKPNQSEAEIRQKHQIDENKILIGIIGNIKEWKGQETMIRALPKIVARFPNLVCLLVGDTAKADQYYRDRLEKLMQELGVTQYVVFTGYTPNVANYLNLMQVVIHTSVDPEPFGRVLIEAMSMKKTIIGTRAGAVPEIIDHGKTGFTFPPGDSELLAEFVLDLLSNSQQTVDMGLAGYRRLQENFLISVNVARTEVLYEKVCGATG